MESAYHNYNYRVGDQSSSFSCYCLSIKSFSQKKKKKNPTDLFSENGGRKCIYVTWKFIKTVFKKKILKEKNGSTPKMELGTKHASTWAIWALDSPSRQHGHITSIKIQGMLFIPQPTWTVFPPPSEKPNINSWRFCFESWFLSPESFYCLFCLQVSKIFLRFINQLYFSLWSLWVFQIFRALSFLSPIISQKAHEQVKELAGVQKLRN